MKDKKDTRNHKIKSQERQTTDWAKTCLQITSLTKDV